MRGCGGYKADTWSSPQSWRLRSKISPPFPLSFSQGDEAREAEDASKTAKSASPDTEAASTKAPAGREAEEPIKGAGLTASDTAEGVRRTGIKGGASKIGLAASDVARGAGQAFSDAAAFSEAVEAVQPEVQEAAAGGPGTQEVQKDV